MQHFTDAFMALDIRGVQHYYKPTTGVFAGGSIPSDVFCLAFWKSIAPWLQEAASLNPSLNVASVVEAHDDILLGATTFVDDLASINTGDVRGSDPPFNYPTLRNEAIASKRHVSSIALTSALGTVNTVRNISKEQTILVLPKLAGLAEWYASQLNNNIISRSAKYLGPYLCDRSNFSAEKCEDFPPPRRIGISSIHYSFLIHN